jgi:DNA (cytosine-5)-methyltransferase 1
MGVGDIDVMDGSPPCASFSTAGKREAGWGKVKNYSDTKQRTDDLFFEYTRLVKGLQPKVFIAENVSGLVKGTAKGYFKLILQEFKDCGYTVRARVLDARWLGVPQMRQRLIFVGVRNDLAIEPAYPKPLPYQYSVRDALPWILSVEGANGFNAHEFSPGDRPGATAAQSRPVKVEAETDISRYAIGDEWDKLQPGEKSEKYLNLIRPDLDKPSPCVTQTGSVISAASVTHPTEKRKFSIAELKCICAFPDDFQLVGSYAQQWERLGRAVPPVMMAAIAKTVQTEILDECKR